MNTFLLRILPYTLSLIVGLVIYLIAEMHMAHMASYGLVVGIASGLLSIPLIFISYEAIGKICSQKLRNTLFEHLSSELNGLVIDLLGQVHKLLGSDTTLTPETLEDLLDTEENEIARKLRPEAIEPVTLTRIRDEILDSIQRHSHGMFDILSAEEMHTMLSIRKEAGMIAREIEHQINLPEERRDYGHLAADTRLLLENISQWLDECEEEAIAGHRHFRFLAPKE